MYKEKCLLFLIAETPLHPGSGSELGVIDLPIQRERYTDFPKIESSTLKGCIRETFEISKKRIEFLNREVDCNNPKAISILFGPEGEESHAGALTITDAKILLFPIKSLNDVFAWITCPMVIERFKRDCKSLGIDNFDELSYKVNSVPTDSSLILEKNQKSFVVLEEFTFEVEKHAETAKLAETLAESIFSDTDLEFWKNKLKTSLIVLCDSDFRQFIKTSTEVVARTKIDNLTGTVLQGALWTEEYLPQDTVFYSQVFFSAPQVGDDANIDIFYAENPDERAKLVADFFKKGMPRVVQVGGNQTIGKGFVRIQFFGS